MDVHGGEVVAIAGIAGNGQSELFAALSGEQTVDRPDEVIIDGTMPAISASPGDAISAPPSCRRNASAMPPCRA